MAKENVLVELTPPSSGKGSGYNAGSDVKVLRVVTIPTAGAGTVVVDGATYTRTSPLRSYKSDGADDPSLDVVAAGDHSQPPVDSIPADGDLALAIFSASGT
jgi:hypothetical protein